MHLGGCSELMKVFSHTGHGNSKCCIEGQKLKHVRLPTIQHLMNMIQFPSTPTLTSLNILRVTERVLIKVPLCALTWAANPAEKTNTDQHQNTTHAGLAGEKRLARLPYVVFWCWSMLCFSSRGHMPIRSFVPPPGARVQQTISGFLGYVALLQHYVSLGFSFRFYLRTARCCG